MSFVYKFHWDFERKGKKKKRYSGKSMREIRVEEKKKTSERRKIFSVTFLAVSGRNKTKIEIGEAGRKSQ